MRQKTKLDTGKFEFLSLAIGLLCVVFLVTNSHAQTPATKFTKANPAATQSIYREYRGIRIGMTVEEVRTKLGVPVFKSDEQDVFVFSANETAQIAYNSKQKVVTISADYLGGIGAPDYRAVVGSELETRPNGTKYKMIHYNNEGFWVSYSQSGTAVPTVTVTIAAEM